MLYAKEEATKDSNLCLVGTNVVLVPYTKEHVPKYNAWMKSEYLRGYSYIYEVATLKFLPMTEMTASEELTLEEEYNMQKNVWGCDPTSMDSCIARFQLISFDQSGLSSFWIKLFLRRLRSISLLRSGSVKSPFL